MQKYHTLPDELGFRYTAKSAAYYLCLQRLYRAASRAASLWVGPPRSSRSSRANATFAMSESPGVKPVHITNFVTNTNPGALTNTCFALLPNVYSSMVPGNLPSQLEILSTGQNYYETQIQFFCWPVACMQG